MALLSGVMAENTEELGKTESSMEKENFLILRTMLGEKGFGAKEKESLGMMKVHLFNNI